MARESRSTVGHKFSWGEQNMISDNHVQHRPGALRNFRHPPNCNSNKRSIYTHSYYSLHLGLQRFSLVAVGNPKSPVWFPSSCPVISSPSHRGPRTFELVSEIPTVFFGFPICYSRQRMRAATGYGDLHEKKTALESRCTTYPN